MPSTLWLLFLRITQKSSECILPSQTILNWVPSLAFAMSRRPGLVTDITTSPEASNIIREHVRRLRRVLAGSRYLIENVSNSGAAQIRMYGLGALTGLAAVGTTRGAELLLGPFLAVLMGLSLVTVAEAARVLRRSPHRLKLFCVLLGGGQYAGETDNEQIADEIGVNVLGSAAHVFLLEAADPFADAGFDFSLRFHCGP